MIKLNVFIFIIIYIEFQLSRETLDNKTSGIELPKDKVSEYKCESTAFMSLEYLFSILLCI